jgi:hypothetical protein
MLKTDDVMGAWELIKAGLIHNPNDFSMLYQAAICMGKMGDHKMFVYYMDKADENHYLGQEPFWASHMKQIRESFKAPRPMTRMKPAEYATYGKRKK